MKQRKRFIVLSLIVMLMMIFGTTQCNAQDYFGTGRFAVPNELHDTLFVQAEYESLITEVWKQSVPLKTEWPKIIPIDSVEPILKRLEDKALDRGYIREDK